MKAMIESRFDDTPVMFNVSNDLLDDRAALDAAWDRDGYWFFKNVLDQDAVAQLRGVFLKVLDDLGVIDPARTDAAVYNGAPLDDYPIKNDGGPDIDPLLKLYPRDDFVGHPQIKAFFTKLFGEEHFWVPNTEFHAVPPSTKHTGSRFKYIHCEGPNNVGLPLKICWIPLSTIDEETGGLAVAEGSHKPRMNDFVRPRRGFIDEKVVLADTWRRTRFEPGDLLMFGLETLHSGLVNRSDQFFRLSMDIRGMKKSENIPTVDSCAIAINADDGTQRIFRLNEETYCRIQRYPHSGMPLELAEIPQLLKVGNPVYVADDRGNARFIRPQH
jgi:ectoine hydroxylase-related dioxygenase (phytanoyl-CoA dioxygenase family)